MLSTTDAIMNSAGKLQTLEEFVKKSKSTNSGDVIFCTELPEPSEDTMNTLAIIKPYGVGDTVVIHDSVDKTEFLTGNDITLDVNWGDYSEITVVGGNPNNGDVWILPGDAPSVTPIPGISFTIHAGSTTQGSYLIKRGGFTKTSDTYGHCAIAKITGVYTGSTKKMYVTEENDGVYSWVNLIDGTVYIPN